MDGCNASDHPVDAEDLDLMIANLRYLERCVHHAESLAPPTEREVILYALILRHVSACCFLFISEQAAPVKPSPTVPGQAGGRAAFEPDESLISHCREVYKEAFSTFGSSHALSDLMKDWRSSILKNLSLIEDLEDVQIVSEARADQARLPNKDDRERILADILRELDNSWRRRSYAAPSISEVGRYREIRKLVVSSLAFMAGKFRWQENFAAVPIRKPGPLYDEDFVDGLHSTISPYYFIVAEDLVREYARLMMECRLHPSDILRLKEAANPEPKPLPLVQVSITEGDQRSHHTCLANTTRLAHLQNILREMRRIKARPFTMDDFRFYILVREHVESVLWHEQNRPLSDECQMQNLTISEEVRDLAAPFEDSRSGKTREQSVREIIFSLEYIKSRWLTTPPTREECTCYVRIRNVFDCKWSSSLYTSDSGVAPLQEEKTADVIRQFLEETRKFLRFAHQELQLDEEAMAACKKEMVAIPVDLSGGLQDAVERIDRAAVMMFKRYVVIDRMLSDMVGVLENLWSDLKDGRTAIVAEQAAIYLSFPR